MDASETSNRLRRNVAGTARLPSTLTVEAAVAAVMCVLVERLTAGEAHDLLAGAPPELRPLFDRCALHRSGQPVSTLDRAAFLARVADHLDVTPAHAELVTSAVFTAVRRELPSELVEHVAAQLPHGLSDLWLGPPVAAPALDTAVPQAELRRDIEIDIERRAELPPRISAATAFSTVMCALTRRLSGGEARAVLLGLPSDLRELVESCVIHRGEHAEVFDKEALLRDIREHLGVGGGDATRIVEAVLRAAKHLLPQATVAAVSSQLPPDLRATWDAL